MPEFLDEKRSEIGARLNELEPLVDEYKRLEAAAAALDEIATTASSAPARSRATRSAQTARAATTRQRGAAAGNGGAAGNGSGAATATATGTGKRRGRPKGTGIRAKEALAFVTANPGITIPELAEKMGIQQNYLYRVLPGLANDGLVMKDGRGWRPKAAR